MRARKMSRALAAAVACSIALAPGDAWARRLRQRSVTIGDRDQALPTVNVAPGFATVLAFQAPVRSASWVRAAGSLFEPLSRTERTVVVQPTKVVGKPVALNVAMEDGTVLAFELVTAAGVVDAQVEVTIALSTARDSPEALRAQVAGLRTQLSDCRGQSEKAAAGNVAALILAQKGPGGRPADPERDPAQAFETHGLRGADVQNRLLVEARRIYRLLGLTFVVLSVDNRDPQRPWVLGRAVVKITGGASAVDVAVEAARPELEELPPDRQERVVVAFKTPQGLGRDQRLSIALTEKDGSRRAELNDLEF